MEQQLQVPISEMGELAKIGDEPVKHADFVHAQGEWIGRVSLLMPQFVLQFESNCHFSHLVQLLWLNTAYLEGSCMRFCHRLMVGIRVTCFASWVWLPGYLITCNDQGHHPDFLASLLLWTGVNSSRSNVSLILWIGIHWLQQVNLQQLVLWFKMKNWASNNLYILYFRIFFQHFNP